jgi:hypothetical protein
MLNTCVELSAEEVHLKLQQLAGFAGSPIIQYVMTFSWHQAPAGDQFALTNLLLQLL